MTACDRIWSSGPSDCHSVSAASLLDDDRLAGLRHLPRRELYDLPDPRLDVLQKALDRAGVELSDLTLDQDAEGWKVSGHSKYEAEGIYSLAEDITRRHPGARAEVETDDRGRTVIVPAAKIAYVEVGAPTKGRVGFGG